MPDMLIIDVEDIELAREKLPTVDSKKVVTAYLKGKLLSSSQIPERIVDGKSHSFLQAMYYSYSDHRPFTLTPESIWLLILQAFSVHINNNPKRFKKKYPKFQSKRELIVGKDKVDWSSKKDCVEIIANFCDRLNDEINDGFIDNLSSTFSSSNEDEETVFKITSMNTVKHFFEFIVVSIICGIPKVYLKGQKKDWIDIKRRLQYLEKFDFKWFSDKVRFIIERIILEFDGEVEDDFWINMFKIHTTEDYGRPEYVDGWITNFFPFRKTGDRVSKDYFKVNSFRSIVKDIHPQIVRLDFKHRILNSMGEIIAEKPMLMIAGFIGILQDEETFALQPNLGWAISENSDEFTKLFEENKDDVLVYYNLDDFPVELLDIQEIRELELNFESEVKIPEAIKNMKIDFLRLNGKFKREEKKKIRQLFIDKETIVLLNSEDIRTTMKDRIKWFFYWLSPFHHKFIHY